MERLGRDNVVEKINRDALRIAREVADENDKLMAGNISNTPLYIPNNPASHQEIYETYKVKVGTKNFYVRFTNNEGYSYSF